MGLDAVELILAFEERFGIRITDGEAEKLRTPRIACEFIYSRLAASDAKTCQSQRAFYILRESISTIYGKGKREITPESPIRQLSSEHEMRKSWKQLQANVKARSWPELLRPQSVVVVLAAVSISAAIYTWVQIPEEYSDLTLFKAIAAGLITLICAKIGEFLTRPLKTKIPKHIVTVKDLVPFAVTSDEISWTKEQVAVLVKKLVMEILAISEADYHEDADFIDDLGAG